MRYPRPLSVPDAGRQVLNEARQAGGALDRIERLGNALPDPVVIFLWLIGALVFVSVLAAFAGVHAPHPLTGDELHAQSLLSEANVRQLLTQMPETFALFPPLGLVVVVMLGAAVAERSGLFGAVIGRAVRRAPRSLLTPATFAIALLSHHASDAAYVVLIPLAAIVWYEAGRHPLAGIAVAYAGISGAFAGNVLPGQFDALMLGITQKAAQMLEPGRALNPLGNWAFTATLGVLLLAVAWPVADRIVEPRLRRLRPDGDALTSLPAAGIATVDVAQRRGLLRAGLAALVVVAGFAALVWWPGYTPLFDQAAAGHAREAPFYRALIAGFMLLFLLSGWAFGSATGSIRTHRDVVRMMVEGMRDIAPYIVIAFFAAHFIAMFTWSNLGPILAIKGAALLGGLGMPHAALLLSLLLLVSIMDLLIGSASAKWSAMAPIVVPMLMLLGISPEMTTASFRVGDSIFNIVTPVASNFVLVLVMCQRWLREFGVGSLIAMMLPFSIAFGIAGLLLVAIWAGFGLPLGPASPAGYLLGAS
ncbi:MAG: AbgT family transporter [Steroidobacteraceae bacterium]